MQKADFHTHTTFCDGKNTAEEMVLAAISDGLTQIGFSGHSHTPFDESYCMSVQGTAAYREEIFRLQEKYRGQIDIFCGIEQDFYSDMSTEGYDYVIGSVHYLKLGAEYVPVDEGNANLLRAADNYFGGDILRVCETYFDTVALVAEETGCDIIGHFDLIAKYNEKDPIFDTTDPRYIAAWQRAAERLLRSDAVFEINTGAISRGCRDKPYPAEDILEYLGNHGAGFLFSGDCHRSDALCFDFDMLKALAEKYRLRLTVPKFATKNRSPLGGAN